MIIQPKVTVPRPYVKDRYGNYFWYAHSTVVYDRKGQHLVIKRYEMVLKPKQLKGDRLRELRARRGVGSVRRMKRMANKESTG